MNKKHVMINECQKTKDYRMNIDSLDSIPKQSLKEFLEIIKPELLNLNDAKKNDMWMLRDDMFCFLRLQEKACSRFVVRRSRYLFGGGSSKGYVPSVRKSETGKTGMVFGKPILHKKISFLRRKEMPKDEYPRCCQRNESGLAYNQGIGQAVYGGTITESCKDESKSNRNRRDLNSQGTCLSYSGERSGEAPSNLVWRGRSFREKHGYVLPKPWRGEKQENQIGGNGYVESVREI